jgi:uncharacterized protein YebE (UPF0316 family)
MDFLISLHPLAAALLIFFLRIIDVSLGTLRTISVVQGRIKLAVVLGFFETFVWLTAVAQALMGVEKNPMLIIAYCAGFAAGNAVGIQIERKIALGIVVIRMFSSQAGGAIASALSIAGWKPTTFQGIGADGPNTMIFVIAPRRRTSELLETARGVDPHIYYSVDLVREYHGGATAALSTPADWRAIFRMRK